MSKEQLCDLYHAYIACLNAQDWASLGQFVDEEAIHNGRPIGLRGYRAMLEQDFDDIPDLSFNIRLLIADPPLIASRLAFDCHPKGMCRGLPVDGRRVTFSENVIYEVRNGMIVEVWSVIDTAEVRSQL